MSTPRMTSARARYSQAPPAVNGELFPVQQPMLAAPTTPGKNRSIRPPNTSAAKESLILESEEFSAICANAAHEFNEWNVTKTHQIGTKQSEFSSACEQRKEKMTQLQNILADLKLKEQSINEGLEKEKRVMAEKLAVVADLQKEQLEAEFKRTNLESQKLKLIAQIKQKKEALERRKKLREENGKQKLPEYEAYVNWMALEIIPLK
ncbi:hypothetical protein HK096_009848, partial [Nowakowskiella sp. JEL0078]